MASAEKSAPKPKRKITAKEQSERFKQTARELQCDESADSLEKAFRKINVAKVRSD